MPGYCRLVAVISLVQYFHHVFPLSNQIIGLPLSGLELPCDLENMAGNLQDEDFFLAVFAFPSTSTLENSSSEYFEAAAASWFSFDLFSLTKQTLVFLEGFSFKDEGNNHLLVSLY